MLFGCLSKEGRPVIDQAMLVSCAPRENDLRLLLLQEQSRHGGESEPVADDNGEDLDPSGLFCRTCGVRITGEAQRITVNGSHTHTFFNPSGRVFELGCFSQAPGCMVSDESSMQFTWFAGFAWRPAICSGCAVHLGWRFEKGDTVFFSLILPSLTDRR